METSNYVALIITFILGGGMAGAILNLVRARTESKKAPLDRDILMVQGAGEAVAIMQKALDSTDKRLDDLVKDNQAKEKALQTLREESVIKDRKIQSLDEEITRLRTKCEELAAEVHMIEKRKHTREAPQT